MADIQTDDVEPKAVKAMVDREKETVTTNERLVAQRDQLLLQEREIVTLRQDMENMRQTLQTMETETTHERQRLRKELLSYVEKCRQLEDNKRELEENVALYKEQNRILHLKYQSLEAKNLELEEDLKRADKQNDSIEVIRKDNQNLKTQVLMLSELYQGLKDRFAVVNKNASMDEMFAIESEIRNKELKDLKLKLETTIHQMEVYKLKSTESESQMSKKDTIIAEQKQTIESNKIIHKKQLQIENQRIEALKKVIQQLEQHILSLYGQLGLKEHEERLREKLEISEELALDQTINSIDINQTNNGSNNDNHLYTNGNYKR
ncbi:hamartin-like [Oppia nitens]|uniref:hamartin-like n=1 Tax=Oppia nitens TaxID=1686743 RepID=UPI0023DAD4EA|nr:hamartin-like [Oppia nitens]